MVDLKEKLPTEILKGKTECESDGRHRKGEVGGKDTTEGRSGQVLGIL